jgi:hypothetical protein
MAVRHLNITLLFVDRFLKAIVWLRVEDDKGEDKGQQSQL